MNGKIPRITADKLIRVLQKRGFGVVRQSGSHKILRNAQDCRVTVPCHPGTIIHPKIIKRIIEDTGLSLGDFE